MRRYAKWLALLLGIMMTVSLFGCGQSTDTGTPTEGNKPAPAETEKVLSMAIPAEPENLDHTVNNVAHMSKALVYGWGWVHYATKETDEGVLISDTTSFEPGIISSWDIDELDDGRVKYTFHIKEDAVFASGNPVTSDDFIWTTQRDAELFGDWLGVNVGLYDVLKEGTLEKIDDKTFALYGEQYTPAVMMMKTFDVPPFDSKLVKESVDLNEDPWAQEWLKKHPAGGGPYVLDQWVSGSELVFVKNPNYWGEEPDIDKIVLKVVPSVSNEVMLLENDEVDIAYMLPYKEIEYLKSKDGIQIYQAPSTQYVNVTMNMNMEPFDDIRVRKALSYAFPYDRVLDEVYRGYAQPLHGPLATGLQYTDASSWNYQTDLDEAKALLAEAGYDADNPLDISLSFDSTFTLHEPIAVLFQDSLKGIGVNMALNKTPSTKFNDDRYAYKIPMLIDDFLAWVPYENYHLNMSFFSQSGMNFAAYANDRVDEICQVTARTQDDQELRALYKEAQDIIIDEAPWVFVAQPDFTLAMRDNIENFIYAPDAIPRLHLLKLKDE